MTMTPRLRKFALAAHITLGVGWIGAVAGCISPRRCHCDQPGCSDVACLLSRDGVNSLVYHSPVSPNCAANRAYHVTWDPVGLIPALLGPDLTPADHDCHGRLAGGNARSEEHT